MVPLLHSAAIAFAAALRAAVEILKLLAMIHSI
jgi:hypothetical protein